MTDGHATPDHMAYTFRLECGCLVSLNGGTNEPCLIHEHEQITPKEAFGVYLRTVLAGDTPEKALATIRAKATRS